MKHSTWFGRENMKLPITMALLFLLGIPAYAQEPDKERDKPKPQQEERRKQPPEQVPPQQDRQEQNKERQQQERAGQQERQRQQQQDRQQQDRDRQQIERERSQQDRAAQNDRASQQRQKEQREEAGRDRRGGSREGRPIPEETFRRQFGREHHFHVARRDDRRFRYGGYWFEYAEPWPGDWDYDDDVYVDKIDDEYYLIDPIHPGNRILVIVVE
jgi:hypothetical protein